MHIANKTLAELQKRLKTGNRRGVHLNAIPGRSSYKFDFGALRALSPDLPDRFFNLLLTHSSFSFLVSWKELQQDLSGLAPEQRIQLQRIAHSLENIINQSDAIEAEKGINTLGIGYPLLVRRDATDGKITVAPILIWHLHATRTNDLNTWRFSRKADDPVYVNEVLVNHLQADCGIRIETLPEEALADGVVDASEVQKVVSGILSKLNTGDKWPVGPLPPLQSIQSKEAYEALIGNATNAFVDYSAVLSLFEVQKQNIIAEYDTLLQDAAAPASLETTGSGNTFQPLSAIPTDPSQQSILHALSGTRHLLIQGPPGTGKSQTLTALLVNALESGQKVLVVCEKQTALTVLQNSLQNAGLGDSLILIREALRDRKTVVDSIRNRYEDWEKTHSHSALPFSDQAYQVALDKSTSAIQAVNAAHRSLGQPVLPGQNWTASVGAFLRANRQPTTGWKTLQELPEALFPTDESGLLRLLDTLREGQSKARALQTGQPVLFKDAAFEGASFYEVEQELRRYLTALRYTLSGLGQDLEAYRQHFTDSRTRQLETLLSTVNTAAETLGRQAATLQQTVAHVSQDYQQLRQQAFESQSADIRALIREIEMILAAEPNHRELLHPEATQGFGFKLAALFSSGKKQIREQQEQLQQATEQILQSLRQRTDFSAISFSGTLSEYPAALQHLNADLVQAAQSIPQKALQELAQAGVPALAANALTANRLVFQQLKQALTSQLAVADVERLTAQLETAHITFVEAHQELLKTIEILAEAQPQFDYRTYTQSTDTATLLNAVASIPEQTATDRATLANRVREDWQKTNLFQASSLHIASPAYDRAQLSFKAAAQQLVVDNRTTVQVDAAHQDRFLSALQTLTDRIAQALDTDLNALEQRYNWLQFFRTTAAPVQTLLETLLPVEEDDWAAAFRNEYLQRVLRRTFNAAIPTSDEALLRTREGLLSVRAHQIPVIQHRLQQTRRTAFEAFQDAHPDVSIEALYSKRSSAQRKRLSLRNIIRFDPDFFTAQFPVVMTSPDLASNLFSGYQRYFDLVVFDEASQLRLEDTLPALLKGKQIVIAGDEQQMPPSSYFAKVLEGEIEDAEDDEPDALAVSTGDVLLDTESLLDTGASLGFYKRFLDFHYRSQHPYLIDFSNHAFYNSRLQPLPNRQAYTPIDFRNIGGTFSDYENEAEATEVLRILEHEITVRPDGSYPSVGVATFNIHQRNLILRKIQERRTEPTGHAFDQKLAALEANGFFVKNLENIQGDERDIIILSVTYGPNKDGRFTQRFGVLMQEKGYRLLNVIITRARQQMYVLSSVPEEVFSGYKQFLATEGVRRKAAFYAYLAYAKAVSTNNNIRREQILNDLREANQTGQYQDPALLCKAESPFEEEVFDYLAKELGASHLELQKPFAGFRIDLVYQSPLAGVPPIAIECDGAKYHSSDEAYLYDLYRQQILEGNGFVFHRIWSANWWRNPQRETEKLVAFVRKLEAETAIPEPETAA
jgi:very-short-patch-repair endonuclease